MAVILIAAVDSNWGIARQGNIPWNIPADLKFFSTTTKGFTGRGRKNTVIMGRKTFLTLKKPLVDRVNIVVSRTYAGESSPDLKFYRQLSSAISDGKLTCRDVYIIGGESVYKQALDFGIVDKCIISHIPKNYNCDQFLNISTYGFKITKTTEIQNFTVREYE
jgi:dihydrofolate reductase